VVVVYGQKVALDLVHAGQTPTIAVSDTMLAIELDAVAALAAALTVMRDQSQDHNWPLSWARSNPTLLTRKMKINWARGRRPWP
jgi:hypothetical protein